MLDEKVENAETFEPKGTLEIIRDVITHPIDTITNTLQNVFLTSSDEQVTNESELSAQKIEATEVISVDENKDAKTTLETIREVITHPISAISEQVQHVLSSSTSTSHDEQVEQVSSETLQSSPPNNSEQTTSTVRQSFDSQCQIVIIEFRTSTLIILIKQHWKKCVNL